MYEENKKIVQRLLDMITHTTRENPWFRTAEVAEVLDPADFEWTLIGTTPISGVYHTLEEVVEGFFGKIYRGDGRGGGIQGFDDSPRSIVAHEVTALEDGRVLYIGTASARGANGVRYFNHYCWILTLREGKIVKLLEFCDTAVLEMAVFDKRLVPSEQAAAAQS